jgi:lactoylglutathione lyase
MGGEKTANGITFRIRHTMMPVSDLDRSIDFYTRLFGMDIQRLRNAPERSERVAYLGYGSDDESHSLELIQIGAAGERAKMAPWAGHVAIFVSDLYKLCERLKAEGVTFTQEPGPVRPGSKDLVAFIKDRDGYSLELTERHSKSGPPFKITN